MALTNYEKAVLRKLVKEYKKNGWDKKQTVTLLSVGYKKATVRKYWDAINGRE